MSRLRPPVRLDSSDSDLKDLYHDVNQYLSFIWNRALPIFKFEIENTRRRANTRYPGWYMMTMSAS